MGVVPSGPLVPRLLSRAVAGARAVPPWEAGNLALQCRGCCGAVVTNNKNSSSSNNNNTTTNNNNTNTNNNDYNANSGTNTH